MQRVPAEKTMKIWCNAYLSSKEDKKSSLWQIGHLQNQNDLQSKRFSSCCSWSESFGSGLNLPSFLAVALQKVVISLSLWHRSGERRTLYSWAVLLAPWQQTGRNVGEITQSVGGRQESHFFCEVLSERVPKTYRERFQPLQYNISLKKNLAVVFCISCKHVQCLIDHCKFYRPICTFVHHKLICFLTFFLLKYP